MAPDFLARYGVAVVFAWAFFVQAGFPIPAVPMLLGAGALSGSGHMNLALAVGAAMLATLGADVLWYALGRSQGTRVLGTLCRFSLDPDSLIRHAKERFLAHRLRYLVLAKFLPGVNPLAAGLAGVASVRLERFLAYAAAGAALWAGAWIILGYACADVIAFAATRVAGLGTPLAIVLAAAVAVWLVWKYVRRRRFLEHLRKARMTPSELRRRLEAGDHLVIVDLRTALDLELAPYGIPGARQIAPEALQHPHNLIPRDSEVVFYCAEPSEATSARMALRGAAIGFHNVHPLSGGLEAWHQAGFPVESLKGVSPVSGNAGLPT
ncbi:MAG TPA: rhodanese-like domain-containing protein [Candidatus Methylomirabilis sp.]|nr:rhodanese-like domain-containing protein [Candidatus Methylomirabilis sp.]